MQQWKTQLTGLNILLILLLFFIINEMK